MRFLSWFLNGWVSLNSARRRRITNHCAICEGSDAPNHGNRHTKQHLRGIPSVAGTQPGRCFPALHWTQHPPRLNQRTPWLSSSTQESNKMTEFRGTLHALAARTQTFHPGPRKSCHQLRSAAALAGGFRRWLWRTPPHSRHSLSTVPFPGIIGQTLLFTAMFMGISVIWDKEFGFMKEVLVAPFRASLFSWEKCSATAPQRCCRV